LYAQIVGGHCYLMRNAVEMVVSAGKKLKDLYEGTLNTGRYTQRFSVSDLANGNYLISAIFNGNAQHFRLNVIR